MSEAKFAARRLITQNALISAGSCETTANIDWASIEDLSTVIDLFCIYDGISVIGRGAFQVLPSQSNVICLLREAEEAHFIDVVSPDDDEARKVTATARKHLAASLCDQESQDFDDLLESALHPGDVHAALDSTPDTVQDIAIGADWLRNKRGRVDLPEALRKDEGVARAGTFFIRTFLYLAYANVRNYPFTPDAARRAVVENILDAEKQLRGRLLSILKEPWEGTPSEGRDTLERVSPFASLVFERAAGNRERIAPEMMKLRQEFAPLRERAREYEKVQREGSRDEVIDAQRKWSAAMEEIKTNFGPDPRLVTTRSALNFATDVERIVDNPTSVKSWLVAILSLPAHVIARLNSQRPAIEIHRLRPDLPGAGRLETAIRALFGEIKQV